MKKILVVAAMQVERELLLTQMHHTTEIKLANGALLVEGKLDDKPFALLLSGIGKVNAALGTALAIQASKADLVVNSGVAGGLLKHQKPGDRVIGLSACYHDVDVTAFGYNYGQLPQGPISYQADDEVSQFLYKASLQLNNYNTDSGLIVSGDQFVNSHAQVATIKQHFSNACAVEMEAAAIAHTATSFGKPFALVRALSDRADSSAKHDYGQFVKIAAEGSAQLIRLLVAHWA
jgi:adenosylhomocysteine nucleosidase